jgi:hypothetical protein
MTVRCVCNKVFSWVKYLESVLFCRHLCPSMITITVGVIQWSRRHGHNYGVQDVSCSECAVNTVKCQCLTISYILIMEFSISKFCHKQTRIHTLHIDYTYVIQLFPCGVYAVYESCIFEHSGAPANDTCRSRSLPTGDTCVVPAARGENSFITSGPGSFCDMWQQI